MKKKECIHVVQTGHHATPRKIYYFLKNVYMWFKSGIMPHHKRIIYYCMNNMILLFYEKKNEKKMDSTLFYWILIL